MSHVTKWKCLFDMTNILKMIAARSCRQWRQNPAVAITSLIIDAYKRWSGLIAQNADVRPTIVGVTNLRFKTNEKTDTCALYAHHKHICAWPKNLMIHKSLFCRSQTLNVVECDPGPQNTEVQNMDVDCCAQLWFWWWYNWLFSFSHKNTRSHIAL